MPKTIPYHEFLRFEERTKAHASLRLEFEAFADTYDPDPMTKELLWYYLQQYADGRASKLFEKRRQLEAREDYRMVQKFHDMLNHYGLQAEYETWLALPE